MPTLEAWRKAQSHRHVFAPFVTTEDGTELEICECGALRPVQQPETD